MAKWRYTINIKPHLGLDVSEWGPEAEASRDAIVALLKASRDYSSWTLADIVDEMEECDDLAWFNDILNQLYDWADYNRVWMGL